MNFGGGLEYGRVVNGVVVVNDGRVVVGFENVIRGVS